MPHNGSPQPNLWVKLAVVKAIIAAATETEKATKAALEKVMDPGDRKTAALGSSDLGTISYTKTSATAAVTDREAFTDWCMANAPTEVRVRVTLDADDLLAAMLHLAGLPGDDTSEEAKAHRAACYEAVMEVIRTSEPRVRESFEKVVLDRAAKDGMAADPETGEEIPGITVTPPGPGYISARVGDAQKQRIVKAWQGGGLGDVLEVIAAPPELEG